MFISKRDVSFCDICGNRGPCNWCGRREKFEKYEEDEREIKHEENAGEDTLDNDSDSALEQHRDESQDNLSMAEQRVRYESRQLSKNKGII